MFKAAKSFIIICAVLISPKSFAQGNTFYENDKPEIFQCATFQSCLIEQINCSLAFHGLTDSSYGFLIKLHFEAFNNDSTEFIINFLDYYSIRNIGPVNAPYFLYLDSTSQIPILFYIKEEADIKVEDINYIAALLPNSKIIYNANGRTKQLEGYLESINFWFQNPPRDLLDFDYELTYYFSNKTISRNIVNYEMVRPFITDSLKSNHCPPHQKK